MTGILGTLSFLMLLGALAWWHWLSLFWHIFTILLAELPWDALPPRTQNHVNWTRCEDVTLFMKKNTNFTLYIKLLTACVWWTIKTALHLYQSLCVIHINTWGSCNGSKMLKYPGICNNGCISCHIFIFCLKSFALFTCPIKHEEINWTSKCDISGLTYLLKLEIQQVVTSATLCYHSQIWSAQMFLLGKQWRDNWLNCAKVRDMTHEDVML